MATTAALIMNIWTDDGAQLPFDLSEALTQHVEHVANLCRQGYVCGDICDDNFNGWWEIKNDYQAPHATPGKSENAGRRGPAPGRATARKRASKGVNTHG